MRWLFAAALGATACAPHAAPVVDHRSEVATGDDQFRKAVREVAAAQHGLLSAWGTIRLDDHPITYRFATIEPSDPRARGTYVIGNVAGRMWIVRYAHDTFTHPFAVHDLPMGRTEPEWRYEGPLGLQHDEDKTARGDEHVTLGIRGDAVVELAHRDDTRHDACAAAATCPPPDGERLTASAAVTTIDALVALIRAAP